MARHIITIVTTTRLPNNTMQRTALSVTVGVTDGRIATPETKQFQITVDPDTTTPIVTIITAADGPRVGDEILIRVHALDDVRIESRSLTLTSVTRGGNTMPLDQALALDGQGQARLVLTEELIGTLKFDATATDPWGNVGHASPLQVSVPDPAIDTPPTARLLGDRTRTISAPTEILGTVADDAPQNLTWSLTLRNDASGATRTLASGSGAVDAAALGSIDPTMLPNGSYTLTLSAFNGGFWSRDYVSVNVDGALKLGNFTMTFVDLEVPVAGLPITLTRTYDALAAEKQGDFGYGWSLDVANTKVEIQMDLYRQPDFSGYNRQPRSVGCCGQDDRLLVRVGQPRGQQRCW